jgi:hypothetical protein
MYLTLLLFFVQVVDDPPGNSYIEKANALHLDPAMKVNQYIRNKDQNHMVGIYEEELEDIAEEEDEAVNQDLSGDKLEGKVLIIIIFPTFRPFYPSNFDRSKKKDQKAQN